MKIIPKVKNTVMKKVENKKMVQPKPLSKKGKFGSSVKFENELPEEKNSFKNAKQRSNAKPMSPKGGPNNQQMPHDGPFPIREEEGSFFESVPLTQRFSLTHSQQQKIKSPINVRTPSIN
jgi:hypothetical protein